MKSKAPKKALAPFAQGRYLVPSSFGGTIRVLVIGCGGSGSEMVDALVRLHHCARGIGHAGLEITLQDGDTVSPSNVGRARFLPADVGQNKATLLASRYGLLFGIPIRAIPTACTAWFIRRISEHFDLVITCVDKASFRVKLADYWRGRESETLWLDLGNGDYTGQCVLGTLGQHSVTRLPTSVDLRPDVRTAKDDDAPSCSMAEALKSQSLFVNRLLVDASVAMLWRLLAEGFIENHGAFIDMRAMKMSPLAIHNGTWRFLGFNPDEETLRKAA